MYFALPITDSIHDSVVVISSFKPEEILAMTVFFRWVDSNIDILIVPSDDNRDKLPLAQNFINSQFSELQNVKYDQGMFTESNYPEVLLNTFGESEFKGEECAMEEFLDDHHMPLILAFSPPRKFTYISDELLEKSVLALYIGPEFKQLFTNDIPGKDWTYIFNHVCKTTIIYEQFNATEETTYIHRFCGGNVIEVIEDEYEDIYSMLKKWSIEMENRCMIKINEISSNALKKESAERVMDIDHINIQTDILKTIDSNKGILMELGPQSLAVCLIKKGFYATCRKSITFEEEDFMTHKEKNDHVISIFDVECDKLYDWIAEYIYNIFLLQK